MFWEYPGAHLSVRPSHCFELDLAVQLFSSWNIFSSNSVDLSFINCWLFSNGAVICQIFYSSKSFWKFYIIFKSRFEIQFHLHFADIKMKWECQLTFTWCGSPRMMMIINDGVMRSHHHHIIMIIIIYFAELAIKPKFVCAPQASTLLPSYNPCAGIWTLTFWP